MSPDAVTQYRDRWALFLDVDGTLLEVAETPQRVHVPERIKQLLVALTVRFDGAVALVSGRSLDDVDRLFAPLRFCVAGLCGCEYRESSGCVTRSSLHAEQLIEVGAKLKDLVRRHQELYLEDKRYGLAVHFRLAPQLRDEVHRAVIAACSDLRLQFAIEVGPCSVEILPASCSTATAISLFMQQAPFAQRIPVFLGNDAADEPAFHFVNGLGGISIKVGATECTAAHHRLSGVEDVVRWLERIATHQSGCN